MAGRPKSNPPTFTGMSLSQWQSADTLVQWARDDKTFKLVIEVLFDSMHAVAALQLADGSRQAGRVWGWAEAIATLQALSQRADKPVTLPDPDYGTGGTQAEQDRASD